MSQVPGWLILVGALLVGYFVIGKVIDFFRTNSAWDDPPKAPPDDAGNRAGDDQR